MSTNNVLRGGDSLSWHAKKSAKEAAKKAEKAAEKAAENPYGNRTVLQSVRGFGPTNSSGLPNPSKPPSGWPWGGFGGRRKSKRRAHKRHRKHTRKYRH